MAAENANTVRNLFGKSFLIESKEPGRTNRHACTVTLAQISINQDLTHEQYPTCYLPAERLKGFGCSVLRVSRGSMSWRVHRSGVSLPEGTYREALHCAADWSFR